MTPTDTIRKISTYPRPTLQPKLCAPRPRACPGAFGRFCSLRLVGAALVFAWVYFLVPRSMEDQDIWWHLRNAALGWQTHSWLHHDVYSFTAAGTPWIDHEWLAEIPFLFAWRVAGRTGLYLVTLLTIEFILLGVYWLTGQKAKDLPGTVTTAALTTAIASVLATVSFGPRTLLFGWACLIVELFIFENFAAKAPASSMQVVLALPLLFCLWVNLHGSWLIGMVLFAVFIVSGIYPFMRGSICNPGWTPSQWRTLSIALLLSLGALFINPYGWHLVLYPFDLAFHQPLNIASVQEWKPLDFQSVRGFIFLVVLAAIWLTQLLKPQRWALWEIAFAAIGTCAAFRHSRFLFLGAMLVTPFLGRHLAHVFSREPTQCGRLKHIAKRQIAGTRNPHARNRPLLNAVLIAAVFGVAALATFKGAHGGPRNHNETASAFPAAALPCLQALHPHDRIFNEYQWGGYLTYYVPHLPVFIDSRMDIYERNGTLRDYLDIIYLKGSLTLLDRYRIRYVLFEKETPLVYLLQQTHAWSPQYDDGKVVLLERLSSPAAHVDAISASATIAATKKPVR